MTQSNPALTGIGLRLLAAFLMTTMSAAVHTASKDAPVGQIMFWRSAVALLPICAYAAWRGGFPGDLRTRRPGLHITRSLLGAFSMALSFLSLAYLPVANALALAYLAPVLVLPFAALMLRENLSRAVVFAVALGFGGVILMLWNALELPGDGAVIGLCAGIGYAVTMAFVRVHTKKMTVTESASAIAFYFAVVSMGVGLATLPFGWAAMSWPLLGSLGLAGLLGGLGHVVSNEAVARAPVSTLAPFDFTGLVWALGIDLVIFGVLPGPLALAGIVAITCAGLLVTLAPMRRAP